MKEQRTFIDKILKTKTRSHVLFWLVLVLTTTFLTSLNHSSFQHHLINNLTLLPTQLMTAYLLAYFQLPKLIYKKKYLLFIVSCLISIILFTIIARLSIIHIAEPFLRFDYEPETLIEVLMDPHYLLMVYVPAVYLLPLIFVVVKTINDRFEEKHQLEILLREKTTTELNFLKAQIHPHFLFNTLNNLYTLTLEKSELAPEVVIKLSEMLDYMLYQCSDPKVLISKEVALVQNYIDLEMLRYGDKLDLQFEQNIDDQKTEIAPLILLSMVENAFKHGASVNLINPTVHINLEVQNQQITFSVFNTKSSLNKPPKPNSKKGVGSTNIKRQLDLIYPHNHELLVEEKDESYFLVLKIFTAME